jgi:hypothetical protein
VQIGPSGRDSRLLQLIFPALLLVVSACSGGDAGQAMIEAEWVSLFNGRDLSGWVVPEGDNGHWTVMDGVIDYDARSEAAGDKNLWSEAEYGDFVLRIDWRLKQTTGLFSMPVVLADGTHQRDEEGNEIRIERPNADSGIYLRGNSKSQVNIWCWPIGSGEVYGYRMDGDLSPEVRAGVTPIEPADRPVGEWNTFEITMKGDRLTIVLNGKTVIENAELPGIPARGRLALQHHGGYRDGQYQPASSLIQFRNIRIRELN